MSQSGAEIRRKAEELSHVISAATECIPNRVIRIRLFMSAISIERLQRLGNNLLSDLCARTPTVGDRELKVNPLIYS